MFNSFSYFLFFLIIGSLLSSCIPAGNKTSPSKLVFNETLGNGFTGDNKAQSIEAFKITVYPVLQKMTCVECHGDARINRPYFAVSDATAGWQALLIDSRKVNLENPDGSRIYIRLKNDLHNCKTSNADTDCNSEAVEILEAIVKWKELSKAFGFAGIKTNLIKFQDSDYANAETEYGTLVLEAEQNDFPEAMVGRFVTELSGLASNYKFAKTSLPSANPSTTAAARTHLIIKPMLINSNACEVTTSALLSDSTNGPYRIREDGTHINSGAKTLTTLITVKDGIRPYSIGINSLLIRPDKRMAYAKMLTGWESSLAPASGISNFTPLSLAAVSLKTGNFDFTGINVSSTRTIKTAIPISNLVLLNNQIQGISFITLPYFFSRDDIFNADNSFNASDPDFSLLLSFKSEAEYIKLKNVFKLPTAELINKDVLRFFENNDNSSTINKFRKDLLFQYVKTKLDNLSQSPALVPSQSSFQYGAIVGMDATRLYSLYGDFRLNIRACPGDPAVCDSTTQILEVTTGSAISSSADLALTYDNALDILKVNSDGTAFELGSSAELNEGKAFRRIDVYAYHSQSGNGLNFGVNFSQSFSSFDGTAFSQPPEIINFPISRPTENLNLRAFHSNAANALSRDASLANFQKTLFPVMQNLSCIGCHSGSQPLRVLHSSVSSVTAFNEIERVNLVNFVAPEKSFRRAVFPSETNIAHNCPLGNCQAAIIDGINQWNAENEISKANNKVSPYRELTEKERTPGMLEYKFKATQTGAYNIWTKIKSSTSGQSINLRMLDDQGFPLLTYFTTTATTATANSSCINYTFSNTASSVNSPGINFLNWTWFTPGRLNDLGKVDARGVLKETSPGVNEILSNNRTYWRLVKDRVYTVQIFEAATNGVQVPAPTQIDAIAIDYVANLNDILDFQPDLLTRDENNIADYRKRVLTYDISNLLGLTTNSAFFKVEVKLALGGQNYIFRNPRFVSPNANIAVKGIKLLINGSASYTDASWNTIDVTTGNDKILTFAPLITLIKNGVYGVDGDVFQFVFDKLEKSTKVVAELDPRGSLPIIVDGRKCRKLALFLNSVKPILRSARLMLKDDIASYNNDFPGSNRNSSNTPQMYQCMTCHNDTHPYFKMTTFNYPEVLCAQALSRVDFSNYRNSLLVRGIDGTGIHPKLHFVEELQYTNLKDSIVAYNTNDGARILSGQFQNLAPDSPAFFSKWIANTHFTTYTQDNLGLASLATWTTSTPSNAEQNLARAFVGQFKRIQYAIVPNLAEEIVPATNPITYVYPLYEPLVHQTLIGRILLELDNLVTMNFPIGGFNKYNIYTPSTVDVAGPAAVNSVLGRPVDLNGTKNAAGDLIFNANPSADVINDTYEALKSKYRDVILEWIKQEDEAFKAEQAALGN